MRNIFLELSTLFITFPSMVAQAAWRLKSRLLTLSTCVDSGTVRVGGRLAGGPQERFQAPAIGETSENFIDSVLSLPPS